MQQGLLRAILRRPSRVCYSAREITMPVVPEQFLVRVSYHCTYVKGMPKTAKDSLLDLPESAQLEHFGEGQHFADVRLAGKELGLGLQIEARGKEHPAKGNVSRPRDSDGIPLWLDPRDARPSPRGSRYCHQLHSPAAGGGPEQDEP